jgi:hypothetical protein
VEKSQILEERSQDQNFIYYMIPFVWHSGKSQIEQISDCQ